MKYSSTLAIKLSRLVVEDGQSVYSVCREFSPLDEKELRVWCALYRQYGATAFAEEQEFDLSLQKKIVEDKLQSSFSIRDICVKYRITSRSRLRNWIRTYKMGKKNGYKRKHTAISPKGAALSETDRIKQLERELLYVKAENALLKKVKALVEEQQARAHLNGQKPSKN